MLLAGGAPTAMLGAYLDDSSDHRREQYFAFGGIMGNVRQIDLFNLLWLDATHQLTEPFRSTDCETGHGQFEKWDRPDRAALMAKLVTLIKDRGVWGFASVVSIADYRAVFPNSGNFDPFYLCVKSAIVQLALMANAAGQDIDMWFEEGDHDGKIQSIHKDLKTLDSWKHRRRLLGITPRDKRFVPLQGADLFAREAFKYFNNEGVRLDRKPFVRLRNQLIFHCWRTPALEELRRQGGQDNLEVFSELEIPE
jgi:hypothetical protein